MSNYKEIKFLGRTITEDIQDLLITALEGGSNYWYWMELSESESHQISQMGFGQAFSEKIFYYLMFGGAVQIYDVETDDHLGQLDWTSLELACTLMHNLHQDSWFNFMMGDYDAFDADIFFQLAVMQEVVYG